MGVLDRFKKWQQRNYEQKINAGLNRAYGNTTPRDLDLDVDKRPLVFLSDLHKGTRDSADDFQKCEDAYRTCLGHYYENGYRLFVLGDVEELWEDWPGKVIEKYRGMFELERRFHDDKRYERFWGNHDDLWKDPKQVAKHLDQFFKDVSVHEAMKLRVKLGGKDRGVLFLVHGHQGTAASDSKSKIPRLFVRYVWRNVQRITKKSLNTPATEFGLRLRHNRAMYDWAEAHPERLVMIAGHTHKPVFWTRPAGDQDGFSPTRPEIGASGTTEQPTTPSTDPFKVPCYFNTGCCAFTDGDVTAIEIKDGKIRLVRWLDDEGRPQAKVLTAEEDLADVFSKA